MEALKDFPNFEAVSDIDIESQLIVEDGEVIETQIMLSDEMMAKGLKLTSELPMPRCRGLLRSFFSLS